MCGIGCCDSGYTCTDFSKCELPSDTVSCLSTILPDRGSAVSNYEARHAPRYKQYVEKTAVILDLPVVQIAVVTLFVLATHMKD
jgi:hypothetical protein